MSKVQKISDFAKETGSRMIDLKYVDLVGRWKHITVPVSKLNDALFEKGIGFDGSSTAGFKQVEKSDTNIIPDPDTLFIDPFWQDPTISMICDVVDAETSEPFPLDPRHIAKKAENHLISSGIADASLWGPEHEFFIFDGIQYSNKNQTSFFNILEDESYIGYTTAPGSGYHVSSPADKFRSIRSEICLLLEENGVPIKYHHGENGWPGQQEIETSLESLVKAADSTMLIRYFTRNVAAKNGKAVTFMPKPMANECGSGMHVHQVLNKDNKTLFYDKDNYAGLSQLALYYIGGILKHGPALTGLICASTNSYRRLVPGFEAPTLRGFGLGNRTVALRIPSYANSADTKRIEFRTPDAICNIYICLAAQLMAGIDGIVNKIDPVKEGFGPFDVNIFDLPEEEQKKIGYLPDSLEKALQSLQEDHEFLLAGDVFPKEVIDNWINYKTQKEVLPLKLNPTPHEFELYYDF